MKDIEILELSYKKPATFGKIFDKYHKRFLHIAKSYLGSNDAAEDAVQNTFVKIYRYGHKFVNEKGDFKNWSSKILQNCIVDEASKRKIFVDFSYELENTTRAPDNFEQYESSDFIRSIFKKIDKAGADILEMRFVFGKSFKQIGKAMDISSGAARVKVHRAKKFLGEFYKQV